MARFFISYRRTDTAQIVGRMYEKLATYFGEDAIFVDVEDILPGTDFRERIQGFISHCDALLVVIGPRWVECFEGGEEPDYPEDYVRIEIELALHHAIPILPVLVGQTPMPGHDELPSTISQLALRNAFRLDVGKDFNAHMNRLISYLDSIRIAKTLDTQQFTDFRLIHDACRAVVALLAHEFELTKEDLGFWRLEFWVYGSHDFDKPMSAGVSLFLHRIVQDSTSLIELHFILTAWAGDASGQHLIVGWMIDRLRRNPILPVDATDFRAIPPGITLRVFPSMQDARDIWSSITGESYQISVSYILRVAY